MLSIVIPTYNEAPNLAPLAESIGKVMREHDIVYELLIVDDDSPDGTADVADELSRTFPIRLLRRGAGARDLSLAVLDGIEQAQFDNIVVMDADLSHPPERIPDMLAQLGESRRTFVLGSRYAEGGGFDRSWSPGRFLNSYIATRLAKPLTSVSDPMSGFFALNRRHAGNLADFRPIGYKIALELLVRGGFSEIREVPIRFTDRELGASKLNPWQQLKYLRHLRRLYLYRFGGIAEFLHFSLVGASGFLIDASAYYLLQVFGFSHQVARALSFWPAVSWNWIMNRTTTFAERKRRPRIRQWFEFVISSLMGFSINWGTYILLTTNLPFFNRYRFLAFVFGIGAASVFNFTVSSMYVYSERRAAGRDNNSAAGLDRREEQ